MPIAQECYNPSGGIVITENGCACESEDSVARFHKLLALVL